MSFDPARVVPLVPVVDVLRGEIGFVFEYKESFDYSIGVAEY